MRGSATKSVVTGGLLLLIALAVSMSWWLPDSTPAPMPAERTGASTSGNDAAGSAAESQSPTNALPTANERETDAATRTALPTTAGSTSLIVRLLDATTKQPLIGYQTAVRRTDARGTTFGHARWQQSDARGEVRNFDIEAGRYVVQVAHCGDVRTVEVVENQVHTELVELAATGVITGRVSLPDGRPARRALIMPADVRFAQPVLAYTDGDGRFRIEHARPLRLIARSSGYASSWPRAVAPDLEGPAELHLHLRAASRTIAGVATNADGVPLDGAFVAIVSVPPGPAPAPHWLKTDQQGRFDCNELTPDRYDVFVAPRSASDLPITTTADARQEDVLLRLQCPQPAWLHGTIATATPDGLRVLTVPLGGGYLHQLLGTAGRRFTQVGSDGSYRAIVPAGRIATEVLAGASTLARHEFETEAGGEHEWNPSVAAVHPLLLQVTSWDELPDDLRAVVRSHDGNVGETTVAFASDGTAEVMVEGSANVDVTLILQLHGQQRLELLKKRSVPNDQGTLQLELRGPQQPNTLLCGRLVDQRGKPVADREMVVSREGDELSVWITFHTSADGRFEVGPLPQGTYAIDTEDLRDLERWQTIEVRGGARQQLGDLVAAPE